MNNLPAMTEEHREYLNQRLRTRIRSLEISERKGHISDAQQDTLNIYRIALAALTAKSIAWIETGTDGFQRGSKLINYFTSDIQGFDNGTLIYAAPPAPVLQVPDEWLWDDAKRFCRDREISFPIEAAHEAVKSFRAAMLRNIEGQSISEEELDDDLHSSKS